MCLSVDEIVEGTIPFVLEGVRKDWGGVMEDPMWSIDRAKTVLSAFYVVLYRRTQPKIIHGSWTIAVAAMGGTFITHDVCTRCTEQSALAMNRRLQVR